LIITKNYFFRYLLFYSLIWLGSGCNPSSDNNHQQYAQGKQIIHIKDKQGNHIVKFSWDDRLTSIETDQKNWKNTSTNQTYLLDNRPLMTVKSQGLEITVSPTAASATGWQIRFLENTMYVSSLKHPNKSLYKVTQRQTDKFWVYQSGREIGKTKIKNGIIDVDGYGIDLKIPAQTNAYAYTLLMMYNIPETVRFTLMVELLKKGI